MGEIVSNIYLFGLLLACCHLAVSQMTDCKVTISKDDFYSYVLDNSECRVKADLSQLQNEFPLVAQAFTLEGDFDKDGIDYPALEAYCESLATCKSTIRSCESDLNDFIESAGMALCQNGNAMSKDITDAAEVLSTDPCSGDFEEGGSQPYGCYFSMDDTATFPTYLATIKRKNKIESAHNRCVNRYLDATNTCSPRAIKALAVILAGSNRVESIGRSYDRYTQYEKPEFGSRKTRLSMHGFAHLYKGDRKESTCLGLAGSKVLLWNTYIRIDGTLSTLEPTVDTMLLSNVYIQFSNEAGQVVDSYITTTSDDKLSTKTQRQQADADTSLEVEVVDEIVVIYHPVADMKISIGSVGDALSLVVSIPTDLYDLETAGVLVDGCEAYGGTPVEDLAATIKNASCTAACSSSSAVSAQYKSQCAYDCDNGIAKYEMIYVSKKKQNDEVDKVVKDGDNGASMSTLSVSVLLLLSIYLL